MGMHGVSPENPKDARVPTFRADDKNSHENKGKISRCAPTPPPPPPTTTRTTRATLSLTLASPGGPPVRASLLHLSRSPGGPRRLSCTPLESRTALRAHRRHRRRRQPTCVATQGTGPPRLGRSGRLTCLGGCRQRCSCTYMCMNEMGQARGKRVEGRGLGGGTGRRPVKRALMWRPSSIRSLPNMKSLYLA